VVILQFEAGWLEPAMVVISYHSPCVLLETITGRRHQHTVLTTGSWAIAQRQRLK
jgi:hypothetical protein